MLFKKKRERHKIVILYGKPWALSERNRYVRTSARQRMVLIQLERKNISA